MLDIKAGAVVLSCAAMKALEARAFADGVTAEALMEEAGGQIAQAVQQFAPEPGRAIIFFGKGHNGGDALVAARHLARAGWQIALRPAFAAEAWAELTARQHRELQPEMHASVPRGRTLVVLDGLLGIGAGGPLREPIREAAREINRLRAEENALVFALDLPTGLDGDSGAADEDAVRADFTLTIGCAKAGLLADAATAFVGRLAVLPLDELTRRLEGPPSATVATAANLAPPFPRRRFDLHKGDCGRVVIVAGSPGFLGAAIMTAEACVHAGAGLVTLLLAPTIYPVIASRLAPEIMVRPVGSYVEALSEGADAIALGPGLGKARRDEMIAVIGRAKVPVIVDADALNALATQIDLLTKCAGPRLLTPHPGEMARLDPEAKSCSRRETVERFNARFPATLLLKGARTLIGTPGQPLSYNSTGTPGMASGGMGDVLTGVLAALAAQKLPLHEAARLGAWLCGRAAEIAITRARASEESLSATQVTAHLGEAFRDLREKAY